MRIVGLTGSVGMGKSTAGRMLKRLGYPVHESDHAVRRLLTSDPAAIAAIGSTFPGTVRNGQVNRQELAKQVFDNGDRLRALENILHPLVRQSQFRFLQAVGRRRCRMAVLDIPLLFETNGTRLVDATVVVSAPAFLQAQRVLRRPGMTRERLQAVLKHQMPDWEKRRRADFVVSTGLGRGQAVRVFRRVLARLSTIPATHWPPRRFAARIFCDARNRSRH